jgi:pimeloyl-ACP methyl ester carboxylesterase
MKNRLFFYFIVVAISLAGCNHIPYGNNHIAGKYYNIRGMKMYCEVYGHGKPLLLIHGDNGSISTFKDIIPHFTDQYRVIIADSRSQGGSVDLKDSLSFEMMADDYAALLDSLKADSSYVIGWSDGGINALLLAMRHPEKVKMLASSGANLWPDSTAITPKDWKIEQVAVENLKKHVQKTAEEKKDRKLLLMEWEQPHIALAQLHSIKCPALIMCGDHDMIREEHTRLIFDHIPKANLWIVNNSGHAILFEHRRKFIDTIQNFFATPYRPRYRYQ